MIKLEYNSLKEAIKDMRSVFPEQPIQEVTCDQNHNLMVTKEIKEVTAEQVYLWYQMMLYGTKAIGYDTSEPSDIPIFYVTNWNDKGSIPNYEWFGIVAGLINEGRKP